MTSPNPDALFADPRAWLNAYHVPDRVRSRQRAILGAIGSTPRTARQIASVVGCSPRTVYRDVECLRDLGASIGGAAGFGYVLMGARQ